MLQGKLAQLKWLSDVASIPFSSAPLHICIETAEADYPLSTEYRCGLGLLLKLSSSHFQSWVWTTDT